MSVDGDFRPASASGRQQLVLLHGWGSRREVFAPLVAALGVDFDIVALDLPAHGAAREEPFPRGTELLLEWLRARVPRGAVLAGWSLGGALGLRFAQAFPAHLAGLVTFATGPCFLQREDWRAGMEAARFAAFRDGLLRDKAAQWRRFAALQALADVRQRDVARQLGALGAPEAPAAELLAALDTLAGLDLRTGLATLALPVLHVLGERDAIVPVAVAAEYARLQPDASVWLVRGAAHVPQLSRPAAVAARVRDFVLSRSVRSAGGDRCKRDVARSFGRAAPSYEGAARLQRAVGEELLALAHHALPSPVRVLDLGCGTGHFAARLAARYAGARITGLDIADGMLRHARARADVAGLEWVCGDAEQLPLAAGSVDLLFSSLALQWCEHAGSAFREIARVLAPGGQALVSTLGDDTLWELRAAWRAVDDGVHVNRFERMSVLVESARAAGLTLRAASQTYHVLAYREVQSLARELRALGAHNVNPGRPAGLAGRGVWRRLQAAYGELANPDGSLPATYRAICLRLEKSSA